MNTTQSSSDITSFQDIFRFEVKRGVHDTVWAIQCARVKARLTALAVAVRDASILLQEMSDKYSGSPVVSDEDAAADMERAIKLSEEWSAAQLQFTEALKCASQSGFAFSSNLGDYIPQ